MNRDAATDFTIQDFEGTRLKKSGVIPVLFTTSWCPFCIRYNPIFASKLEEKAIPPSYVDLSDLDNPLWEVFQIKVVPTVMVFGEGDVIFRKDGALGRGLSSEVMDEVIQKTNRAG